uniref:Uncharacterized protein n=1 Tax=Solanum lycopersicum TaxID=4081 RepID=A0A3Q7FUK2_SOLLC
CSLLTQINLYVSCCRFSLHTMTYGKELFLISQTVKENFSRSNLTIARSSSLFHFFPALIFTIYSMSALFPKKKGHVSHLALTFDESVFGEKNPTTYSYNKFWKSVRFSLDASKNKLINAEKRALRVQFNNHGDLHDMMKLLDGNDFQEDYLKIESFVPRKSTMSIS